MTLRRVSATVADSPAAVLSIVRVVGLVALFAIMASRPAHAAAISVGTPLTLSATTIVVPITITDGLSVSGWQFDLSYDRTDLQVNASCDPFRGDVYCSLLTGPVTEGDFFAAGVPFNLLVPGFVDLDPITLDQTGHLFGVNGGFGGFPPAPSGNGTLAFVEFTLLGAGTSPITVNGSVDSPTAVPEPATVILVITGLAMPRIRQLSRRVHRR